MIPYLFKKHRVFSALVLITLLLTLVSLLILALNYGRLGQSIVLHFDQFHGVDVFGSRSSILWIWLLGIAVLSVNSGLIYEFYNRERFLSYIFLGASVLSSLFVLIVISVIVSIN
ncbi:MAG: hypothetical protein WCO21_02660 [bacterium]|nr:hypothetical protein [Candidatus Jorgensenbacteria bacterium]